MIIPPVTGQNWRTWAEKLRRSLQNLSQLSTKTSDASATQDGILLWDAANGYPVVSRNGVYRQIVLADGFAYLARATDVTAAAVDTAYAIEFDALPTASGISLGTPATRIVFAEGGRYSASFTAQIESTSASDVKFYFWPRINGTDATGSTMIATLHSNGSTTTVSRSALFDVSPGDYLEAMWAVDSASGFLSASAATAFAPASPAATLSLVRINA